MVLHIIPHVEKKQVHTIPNSQPEWLTHSGDHRSTLLTDNKPYIALKYLLPIMEDTYEI
jgi:hypothetical protein